MECDLALGWMGSPHTRGVFLQQPWQVKPPPGLSSGSLQPSEGRSGCSAEEGSEGWGAAQSRARGWASELEGPRWDWSWTGGTQGEALHSRLPGAECRQKPASSLWWEKVEECWARWCLLRSWWQLFRGELQASLLRGRRDLPGPGIEPVFPALAGGFLSSVPPGEVHDGNS